MTTTDRARAYLQKLPPAVSGQQGHNATIWAASCLVNGFALGPKDAFALLSEWNRSCLPPWQEKELVHKINSAGAIQHKHPRGYLLGDRHSTGPTTGAAVLTPEEVQSAREQARLANLKARAEETLAVILRDFAWPLGEMALNSPTPVTEGHPSDDIELLLRLFQPADVVWIGGTYDSGKPEHAANFRTAAEWVLNPEAIVTPRNFTCPATFWPETISRCNENVLCRRFFVIESDVRTKEETAAIIQWCRQFMRLRAVVDTAGRSIHGWFTFPAEETFEQLRAILPGLGCDPAMFKASQPCRMPGVRRADKGGKWQSLLWLDLGGERE